jgi:hypothetical protein
MSVRRDGAGGLLDHRIYVRDHDLGSFSDEGSSHRRANASGGARDDGDFAGKAKVHAA